MGHLLLTLTFRHLLLFSICQKTGSLSAKILVLEVEEVRQSFLHRQGATRAISNGE